MRCLFGYAVGTIVAPRALAPFSRIDYNGSIEVHSSLLNVVLHDEPHIEI
jgi:hypothetical protein